MAEITRTPEPTGLPVPGNPEEVKSRAGKMRARIEVNLPDKVHTWPYLVRAEFIAGTLFMVLLTVWSIVLDAPLEEPANPNRTPNPSKAPWYFLGLQEMLVYFDPWIAGVLLPSLIIVGLMAIPYIDTNPRGNGYYTIKERPFAVWGFMFGFWVLWVILIVMGVFMRGPGWNLFLPGQYWDPHKVVALTSVDLPYAVMKPILGAAPGYWLSAAFGAACIGAYFSLGAAFYYWKRSSESMRRMGLARYTIAAALFLTMMALPIKMAMRIFFNIKYVMVTPWFNI
jgi:hypothetical protein